MWTSFVSTSLFSVFGEENLFCKFVLHLMGNPINDNIMGTSFVLCFDLVITREENALKMKLAKTHDVQFSLQIRIFFSPASML